MITISNKKHYFVWKLFKTMAMAEIFKVISFKDIIFEQITIFEIYCLIIKTGDSRVVGNVYPEKSHNLLNFNHFWKIGKM